MQIAEPPFCTRVLVLQGRTVHSKWSSLSWYKNYHSPLLENRDDGSSPSLPPWNPEHSKHWKRHQVLAKNDRRLIEAVQRCKTCQQMKPALLKEPIMTCPVPTLPWQIVTSDCFECDNHCDFIEIRKLDTLASFTLVTQLKQVFTYRGFHSG